MLITLFWLSILAVFYIYVGYPAIVWSLARWRPRRVEKKTLNNPVSVVIVAYNEAPRLLQKIDSVLRCERSELIHEILVANDGSTDDTIAVVDSHPDPRVRLVDYPHRRGKPAVLSDTIPQCESSIVILTDARQELHPDALSELAANFADSTVGAVSGELVFRHSSDQTTAAHGIGVYWKYEKLIRRSESRFRSVPGATGALYAIRKELFRPIHEQTLLDDVAIPMQIVMQGKRCLFEPNAIAYDVPSETPRQEAIRKRRTIAGNAQLLLHHPSWLLPWKNPIWLEFVSHKISRLFSPALLLCAVITNLALASQPLYGALLWWHGGFYASAIIGWLYQRLGQRSACFGAQFMFVALNTTTVSALWDAARGQFRATWRRN